MSAHSFVYLTCPVCGTVFPFSAPQYRYLTGTGKTVFTCSKACGGSYRWAKEKGKA